MNIKWNTKNWERVFVFQGRVSLLLALEFTRTVHQRAQHNLPSSPAFSNFNGLITNYYPSRLDTRPTLSPFRSCPRFDFFIHFYVPAHSQSLSPSLTFSISLSLSLSLCSFWWSPWFSQIETLAKLNEPLPHLPSHWQRQILGNTSILLKTSSDFQISKYG